jgi:hypothetical protein
VLLAVMTSASAWLVVLTHLTAALHFVLVSHEICADHGELVHRSASVHHAVIAARGTVATPGGEYAEDEHCPVFGRRLEQAAVLNAPGVRLPPIPFALVREFFHASERVPSRSELLLAAPKQSPPA